MNDNQALATPVPERTASLDKLALVAEARELWGGRVAGQLWAKMGLGKAPRGPTRRGRCFAPSEPPPIEQIGQSYKGRKPSLGRQMTGQASALHPPPAGKTTRRAGCKEGRSSDYREGRSRSGDELGIEQGARRCRLCYRCASGHLDRAWKREIATFSGPKVSDGVAIEEDHPGEEERSTRIRLASMDQVRREMTKLYVEGKWGEREVGNVLKLVNVLALIGRTIEGSDIEKRLAILEERAARR